VNATTMGSRPSVTPTMTDRFRGLLNQASDAGKFLAMSVSSL